MYLQEKTIDDLMRGVIEKLLLIEPTIETTRGKSSEIVGATLKLEDPRSRLSRSQTRGKPFGAVGEFLWYLSKENKVDFITYYLPKYKDESDDGITIHGGYGPRLFNYDSKYNQIENIINLLSSKPTSRRAVIQLFNPADLSKSFKDIPCTCTLQFLIRNDKLEMVTFMRSNDAFFGLPHDIFSFTMLQEIIAASLNKDMGPYTHMVGSLHLYEDKFELAKQYINEGWQSTQFPMPKMPIPKLQESIEIVLEAERNIRNKTVIDTSNLNLSEYWKDIIRLLEVHTHFKEDKTEEIKLLLAEIHSPVFSNYIEAKIK